MTQKTKNYAYLRVSNEAQDEAHQRESIIKYCESNNIDIERFIIDHGISAFKTDIQDREGLQEVLSLAQDGLIDKLIIFESSRLSRNHIQSLIVISELSKYNVKIVSITEGIINEGETSELLNSIRAFINQTESKKMSARIKSAKQYMAKNNKYLGGSLPLGYKVINEHLEVDETLREVIKGIFNTYLNYGTKETKAFLAQNNINITNTQSLMQILRNRCYIGYPYKGEGSSSIFISELRIIDECTFNDVQKAIKNRTTFTNRKVITNRAEQLLCESIVFHKCGEKLYINSSQNSPSISYRCRCKTKGLQKSYSAKKLDAIVSDRVAQWFDNLSKDKLKQKFNESRTDELRKLLVKETRISSLLSTKEEALTNAENRVQEAFVMNYPLNMIQTLTDSIDTLKNAIQDLKDQLKEIENNITNEKLILEKQNLITEKLLDFKYLYQNATGAEKKSLIRSVVQKIIISNWDNVEIEFKY